MQQLVGAVAGQRIDAKLRVIAPGTPAMLVFGPIVEQKEDSGRGYVFD
jgi:hypothetical protein